MPKATTSPERSDTDHASPGRLFIDVSFLMAWHGRPVGIWRIESEICQHLLAHAADPRFCRYDKHHQCFVEVSHSDLAAALQPAHQIPPAVPESSRTDGPRLPWLRKILRDWLPPRLHRLLVRTLRTIRRPPSDTDDIAPLTFAASDTYFLAGLPWDRAYIAMIGEACQSSGMRSIFFAHDIIPLLFPSYLTATAPAVFEQALMTFIRHADLMICNSENTRRDLAGLIQARGLPAPRLATVTPGLELPAEKASAPVSPAVQALLAQPYILYVSTIEKRKNHDLLYKAWLHLLAQGHEDLPHLVLVGQPGWLVDDLLHDLRHDLRIRPYITLASHVSDQELSQLYKSALFTVYPSFYEGWGLPLSESLQAGKFCLAANTGSLPEVGGNLVEYLSPYDTVAWAERILFHARHPEVLRQREARIRAEFRPKTWQQFSTEIHALIAQPSGR